LAKPTPSELTQMKLAIKQIAQWQMSSASEPVSYREAQTREFNKWRLIHKYVHSTPFATRKTIKRSEQWKAVAVLVRDLGEIEVLDWVLLQSQVAHNLERGIQDMRPRKNGPCHPLLLEYVADRKRKAHAILHFAIAGESNGTFTVNSGFHKKTEEILARSSKEYSAHEEGHETLPWIVGRDKVNKKRS